MPKTEGRHVFEFRVVADADGEPLPAWRYAPVFLRKFDAPVRDLVIRIGAGGVLEQRELVQRHRSARAPVLE